MQEIPLDADLKKVLAGGRNIVLAEEGGKGYIASLNRDDVTEQGCTGPTPSVALYGVIKAALGKLSGA